MVGNNRPGDELILLTGATGYVGGRLLAQLEHQGYQVRCLARRPEFLQTKSGLRMDVIRGDVLDAESLQKAFEDVHTAYYLIHSLSTGKDFERDEFEGARNFAQTARRAGVKKIIYLGGLGEGKDLSPHLKSRQEVGRILASSGVLAVEFRAGIIIGSGSFSFEMIRALVERLPVMITPRWTSTQTQPIAIEDVISYLSEAARIELGKSVIVEIGGPDRASYSDLIMEYARQRGLKRWMIPVPVLSPRLSSLWLGLVTPVFARIGRKLVEGLRNETIVSDDRAMGMFSIRPMGYKQAIARALTNEDQEFAQTRWSDSVSSTGRVRAWGGVRFGSRLLDGRAIHVEQPAQRVFKVIERIGGDQGWYYADWLWNVRGWMDLFVGGVGLRRGRRHPEKLSVGDPLDFWRVEDIQPGRFLRLYAEMKLPGRAWLQFEIQDDESGCTVHQTAMFDPAGLGGLFYWSALYPIHKLVFKGMLKGIAAEAGALNDEKI